VLRPGGRFAVSDVIADADLPDEVRADLAEWTGWRRPGYGPIPAGRRLTKTPRSPL
jgi:hypothetical protein